MSDNLAVRRDVVGVGVDRERLSKKLSWDRCVDVHRLSPDRRADVPTLTGSEIKQRRSSLLLDQDVLADELGRLRLLMDGAGYSVTLADSQGVILRVEDGGDPEHLCAIDSVGSMWDEARSGTSGIGTCLIEKAPIAVFHGEHFFRDFAEQACVSLPFLDDDGALLGVLNLSTHNPALSVATHRITANIAREAAERIDDRSFRNRHPRAFIIRLRDNELSTLLIAVDDDGRIVGASRAARARLKLQDSAIGSRSLWGVFERAPRVRDVRDLIRDVHGLRPLASSQALHMEIAPPAQTGKISRVPPPPKPSAHSLAGVHRQPLDRWAGGDRRMAKEVDLIRRMIGSGLPILALGETGVGKDTLARAIHEESSRAAGPYLAFNCAAVPETLIDSELFGYGSGAFTGAKREGNQGRLLEASGGTLFLDEVGDMPLAQQTRLLRVLESGEVMPLGGGKTRTVDLQVIAATHQNIERRVESGEFRRDLFYRLAGLIVRVPALREREDVDELFRSLVAGCAGGAAVQISPEAQSAVRGYNWPGNIREMKHVAQRAVRLCQEGIILPGDLMLERRVPEIGIVAAREPVATPSAVVERAGSVLPRNAAASAEREVIAHALANATDGLDECARQLGMSRATFYRKLKAYGLSGTRRGRE